MFSVMLLKETRNRLSIVVETTQANAHGKTLFDLPWLGKTAGDKAP